MLLRPLLVILFTLISFESLAANPFAVNPDDLSIKILGQVLGSPGGQLPISGENVLMGQLFLALNVSIMILALFMASYIVITAAIHTSREGRILSDKINITSILKLFAALFLITPNSQGYSLIQVMFMWLIVNGIGAANSAWDVVLDYAARGDSISQVSGGSGPGSDTRAKAASLRTLYMGPMPSTRPPTGPAPEPLPGVSSEDTVDSLMKSLFKTAVCTYAINSKYPSPKGSIKPSYNPRNGDVIFGYVNATGGIGVNICGQYELGLSEEELQDPGLVSKVQSGIRSAVDYMQGAAKTVVDNNFDFVRYNSFSENYPYLISAMEVIDDARKKDNSDNGSVIEQARRDGWATAGSYHWFLIKSESEEKTEAPPNIREGGRISTGSLPTRSRIGISQELEKTNMFFTKSEKALDAYINQGRKTLADIKLNPNDLGLYSLYASVQTSYALIPIIGLVIYSVYGGFDGILESLLNLAIKEGQDPIITLAKLGLEVMYTIEFVFTMTMLAILIVATITGVCTASNPLAGLGAIMPMIGMLLSGVMAVLWVPAAGLGLYLPLVPYFVFTVSVVGWVINVIIAIAAAPLVALVAIPSTPNKETFGRASTSLILIVAVALKPILMIFGYVVGLRLYTVAIRILTFSFSEVIEKSVHYITFLALIVLFGLYVSIVVNLAHECFSLIHLLPSKVFGWIDAHADSDSGERDALHKIKQSAESANQQALEFGKSAMAGNVAMLDKAKEHGAAKRKESQKNKK